MLMMAFMTNLIIVICEVLTLGAIKKKGNILKYYTYLQNFLALIVSLVFCVFWIGCITSGKVIPEVVKGLRYIATCGLVATMFVFIAFLGAGKKIAITEEDFVSGFRPQTANIILHYICPIVSLVSFVLFEREINLSKGIWTGIVAIPSCIYWIVYMALSATKRWEKPYQFANREKNNKIGGILTALLIPLSFITISFVLWNIK